MADGMTNAKGKSGSKAELIWSTTSSGVKEVEIDLTSYSQVVIMGKIGSSSFSTVLDVPAETKYAFIGVCNSSSSYTYVSYGEISPTRIYSRYVKALNFWNNTFDTSSSPSVSITKIYGIKEALVYL